MYACDRERSGQQDVKREPCHRGLDVWFVIALPVFLSSVLGWKFWQAGGFMAAWVIGYGIVQAATPGLIRRQLADGDTPDGGTALRLAFGLAGSPLDAPLGCVERNQVVTLVGQLLTLKIRRSGI